MFVSGFTVIRNAELMGYPIVQSICSILHLVDEFVVGLGQSDDKTRLLLESIKNPKIKIFVASGLFDLAVPYYGTDYLLSRLDLSKEEQNRLISRRYPAGHMMYFNSEIRRALKQELGGIFNSN